MEVEIVIPPALVPGQKTDIRDWIGHQKTLGKSRDEIRAVFFALPRIRPTKKSIEESEEKVDDAILEDLKIDVLGTDERGQIVMYSREKKKKQPFRDLSKLQLTHLVQFCGRIVKTKVSASQDSSNLYPIGLVRDAIANANSNLPNLDVATERQAGCWLNKDSIAIVGDRTLAVLNGKGLQESDSLKIGKQVYDLEGQPSWFQFEELEELLRTVSSEAAVMDCVALLRRWRWEFKSAPELVTGLLLATWIQSFWHWRPQVVITGEASTGKSILFTAIDSIFNGLATTFSRDSTIRGIEKHISASGRIVMVDEIDKNKNRESIISMVRSSGRGRDVRVIATSGRGSISTRMSQIFWLAGIESGIESTTDAHRFVRLELLPQAARAPKIVEPSDEECRKIGQGLLAVALRHALEARKAERELGASRLPGVKTRIIETYSTPASIFAAATGLTPLGVLKTFLGNQDDEGDVGIETDLERLVTAICGAHIRSKTALGTLSVEQLIEIAASPISTRYEDAVDSLCGCGIVVDEDRIRIHQPSVKRHLLRDTEWRNKNLAEIFSREKSFCSFNDGKKRAIELDLTVFVGGSSGEKSFSGDEKNLDDGF